MLQLELSAEAIRRISIIAKRNGEPEWLIRAAVLFYLDEFLARSPGFMKNSAANDQA